jgi:hypothetical protein
VNDSPRFRCAFDEEAFAEDLAHVSPAGRAVGERERSRMERQGIARNQLRACERDARDGTRMPGCVKTYPPAPYGDWGMVFRGERSPDGTPTLLCLAFGRRHPGAPWQPSVYEVPPEAPGI